MCLVLCVIFNTLFLTHKMFVVSCCNTFHEIRISMDPFTYFKHTEADRKLSQFCKRHFITRFPEWNVRISIRISLAYDPTDCESTLVEIMNWRRPGDKPSFEHKVAWFNNAYIHRLKSFRSLTPVRITRLASNSKCNISSAKRRRMMKTCLIVC